MSQKSNEFLRTISGVFSGLCFGHLCPPHSSWLTSYKSKNDSGKQEGSQGTKYTTDRSVITEIIAREEAEYDYLICNRISTCCIHAFYHATFNVIKTKY